MRRFRFTLERLRRVREQAENAAGQAVARELAVIRELEARLSAAERRAAEARQGTSTTGTVSSDSLLAHQAYRERRDLEAAAASGEVDRQAARVEQQREALVDAARERAVLDRLHDRQKRTHDEAERRADVRVLDELAATSRRRMIV